MKNSRYQEWYIYLLRPLQHQHAQWKAHCFTKSDHMRCLCTPSDMSNTPCAITLNPDACGQWELLQVHDQVVPVRF